MEKNKLTLVEQLQLHIETVGKEEYERELFVFNCKMNGIDPNAKNAKRKLKRKMKWDRFQYRTWPIFKTKLDIMMSMTWAFILGHSLASNQNLWMIGISSAFTVFYGIRIRNLILNNNDNF